MSESSYTDAFYAEQCDGSAASARVVVPLLRQLLFNPSSVVDVGCGVGAWLAEFRRGGVDEVVGLDGAWVGRHQLRIPEQAFRVVDLTKPIEFGRCFDFCLCLEVAEHIDERLAEQLVDSLVALAPLVVFSAAVPHQTGVRHINEQWPSYWASRFEERGYAVLDCVRKMIWQETAVQWWYAQNMLVFVRDDVLRQRPNLLDLAERTQHGMLDLVHPRMLAMVAESAAGTQRARSWQARLASFHLRARQRLSTRVSERCRRP